MYQVSQAITDLKAEFEGGGSLSVNWYDILRRAGQKVLNNINPETLKRSTPIYGGLTRHLKVYYCPSDVEVPMRLHSSDRRLTFDYMPPAQFYSTPYRLNTFTLEYVNGVRFIVVYHPLSIGSIIIDPMDGSTTVTGVTLTENNFNVLAGSVRSMQGTFTHAAYTIARTLDTPIDISALLYGVTLMPMYFDTAADVESITLRLYTDVSNYYSMVSTQDSVGDNLRDGQNFVRFWLQNATQTGTPDPTSIASWALDIKMNTGKTQTVVLGKMTVQASNFFELDYYSNLLFRSSTGAWSDTPASGYYVNLDRDARGILHYEAARLVFQRAKVERVNAPERQSFDTELAREYNQYYLLHPSSAQPLSYSIMPNIARQQEPYFDGLGYDFGESVGNSSPNDMTTTVYFADSETPSGTFDGVNQTFTLAHVPNPGASLDLVLNGQTLTLGQDYTLAGNIITLLAPYFDGAFASLPFLASYRYTV